MTEFLTRSLFLINRFQTLHINSCTAVQILLQIDTESASGYSTNASVHDKYETCVVD